MSSVTVGEIMVRFTPWVQGTKSQSAGAFAVGFAGAESNMAYTLGLY